MGLSEVCKSNAGINNHYDYLNKNQYLKNSLNQNWFKQDQQEWKKYQ